MYDYLSEFITFTRRVGDPGSYREALRLKRKSAAVIFNQLCREWASRFTWTATGDAKSIPVEKLEQMLLFSGYCGFAKITLDDILTARNIDHTPLPGGYTGRWKLLNASVSGQLDFDGYPSSLYLSDQQGRAYGQYIVHTRDDYKLPDGIRECVLLSDSAHGQSPIQLVIYYADKLSRIETSINAAIRNINGTTIITAPPEMERQIIKQQKAADAGVPYILKYDIGVNNEVKIMTSPAMPEVLRTLFEAYNKIHSDFLQSIGIRANNEIDKRTGVNPLEIVQSRQNVDIVLNDAYNMRLYAIEMLKDMGLTGLNCDLSNFAARTMEYDATGKPIIGGNVKKEGSDDAEIADV